MEMTEEQTYKLLIQVSNWIKDNVPEKDFIMSEYRSKNGRYMPYINAARCGSQGCWLGWCVVSGLPDTAPIKSDFMLFKGESIERLNFSTYWHRLLAKIPDPRGDASYLFCDMRYKDTSLKAVTDRVTNYAEAKLKALKEDER